ncbi:MULTISPECIES: 3-deoxy-D-manno-octulosonic acid transferase [Halocynthiibacter]|uniref:3-deoxy-D-manno-octulosonic acid transferase n=1 Tax=Halocynthiibacter halioticoli TaxID=2986804 RepID=A0AAE3LSD6_9RHOB|nr:MULTISPECIES: glycosyltransferase N-terminal domain-containing protein [Halocynthiibacter]MCV6825688.1 hypothetical protein [Halocynthiibacter halioticoli]MCW4058689.1 hypothetical protein [Halocynthiibacter sp. SDUM655004]
MTPKISLKIGSKSKPLVGLKEKLTKEDTAASREEMGVPSVERPEGPLVWFHATTENKSQPLAKVVRQLSEDWPRVNFLLTSPRARRSTISKNGFPSACIHQYAPANLLEFCESFLDAWAPDIAVFNGIETESPLPRLLAERNIPLLLVNASVSKRDLNGIQALLSGHRKLLRTHLQYFDHIDTIDAATAKELTSLGIEESKVRVAGPISELSATLPCVETDRQELSSAIGGRPTWLASNVASEEDALVLAAHLQASRTTHRLLLIHLPDTPQRGEALSEQLNEQGFRVCLRSRGEVPDEETQVFIADTENEIGLWYRLATVAFLGNSFIATGTVQTPYEAAGLGSAILHGPNLGNFTEAFETLDEQGGAQLVARGAELGDALLNLLPPDRAAAMAHVAWEVTTSGAQATDLAVAKIEDMLDEIGAY